MRFLWCKCGADPAQRQVSLWRYTETLPLNKREQRQLSLVLVLRSDAVSLAPFGIRGQRRVSAVDYCTFDITSSLTSLPTTLKGTVTAKLLCFPLARNETRATPCCSRLARILVVLLRLALPLC
jgi:hypothetical protein